MEVDQVQSALSHASLTPFKALQLFLLQTFTPRDLEMIKEMKEHFGKKMWKLVSTTWEETFASQFTYVAEATYSCEQCKLNTSKFEAKLIHKIQVHGENLKPLISSQIAGKLKTFKLC